MKLPLELQETINEEVDMLHQRPQKPFTHQERTRIYHAFGTSNYPNTFREAANWIEQTKNNKLDLTKADYTLSWLAILTAKKVFPIWESSFSDIEKANHLLWYSLAPEMLNKAEKVLLGKADVFKVFRKVVHDEYYLSIGNIHYDVNEKAVWACYATYYAAKAVFLGVPGIDYSNRDKCNNLSEIDPIMPRCNDFARIAAKAYCAIDPNPMIGKIKLERKGIYKEVVFDPQKRLEFWQWWLTEAIPQAWDLAQQ